MSETIANVTDLEPTAIFGDETLTSLEASDAEANEPEEKDDAQPQTPAEKKNAVGIEVEGDSLTSFVQAHAQELIRPYWMGDAQVTVSEAVRAYPWPPKASTETLLTVQAELQQAITEARLSASTEDNLPSDEDEPVQSEDERDKEPATEKLSQPAESSEVEDKNKQAQLDARTQPQQPAEMPNTAKTEAAAAPVAVKLGGLALKSPAQPNKANAETERAPLPPAVEDFAEQIAISITEKPDIEVKEKLVVEPIESGETEDHTALAEFEVELKVRAGAAPEDEAVIDFIELPHPPTREENDDRMTEPTKVLEVDPEARGYAEDSYATEATDIQGSAAPSMAPPTPETAVLLDDLAPAASQPDRQDPVIALNDQEVSWQVDPALAVKGQVQKLENATPINIGGLPAEMVIDEAAEELNLPPEIFSRDEAVSLSRESAGPRLRDLADSGQKASFDLKDIDKVPLEPESLQVYELILDKAFESLAIDPGAEPPTERLEEMITDLLEQATLDYEPELVEFLVGIAKSRQAVKASRESAQQPPDKGTHEAIKQILLGINKSAPKHYVIGRSTLKLYLLRYAV